MKANEVPEKIIHNGIEYYRVDIIEDLTIDGKTFVKKDSFIRKACEYLNKSCRRFILTEKDIEGFKNYMKGE